MGAGFDRVARAIASDMPRRKVLKFLVGGAIASVGTAIMGEAASAAPHQPPPILLHLNNTFPPIHGKPPIDINRTGPPINFNYPFPPINFNNPYPPISINVTYP